MSKQSNDDTRKINDELYQDLGAPQYASTELLTPQSTVSHKYWYRWYICFIFAALGLLQGVVWNTWSPINESAGAVFNFTSDDITLLANWGPISFLIFMPIYTWLFDYFGLRLTTVSAALFVCVGCGLRCIPGSIHARRILIHIGQFFNGIAGCPVMACPSLISNLWFPPEERITATGITGLFNYFGTGAAYAVGFLIDTPSGSKPGSDLNFFGDSVVIGSGKKSNVSRAVIEKEINNLLYVEFAVSAVIFACILAYFPNKPKLPPSVSASIERMSFKAGLLALLKNKSFWIIIVTASALLGSWGGWTGVMSVILGHIGTSEENSDFIGFVTTAIGCIIAMTVGWLTDRLKGKMKMVYVILLVVSCISFGYFVIIYQKWIKIPFFQPGNAQLWVVMCLLGIALNALVPLGMELAVDTAYPVSEGTAASVLVWFNNLFSFVFLLLLNLSSDPSFSNYVMLAFFVLAIPLVVFGASSHNQRLELDLEPAAVGQDLEQPGESIS